MPILYTFRRCPYAMRARMGLYVSGVEYETREIMLRDKPAHMVEISPKGTVPVLLNDDGGVIDESLAILHWALAHHDPDDWRCTDNTDAAKICDRLISQNDTDFKAALDRYKYPNRYENCDPAPHRQAALDILKLWNDLIGAHGGGLVRAKKSIADIAIFPFVRQFANVDRAWFDGLDLPHLQQWLRRHLENEIFVAIMHKHPLYVANDAAQLKA